MGPNALSSIVDSLGEVAGPPVISRVDGAWEPRGAAFGLEVRGLAAALCGYGLGTGACAAVLGPEGPGVLRAGLAVIASGATLVPLGPDLGDDALHRALASTGAVQAIASDESQLARILSLRPELPKLDLVLLASAAPSERKPAALMVSAAMTVGSDSLSDDPGLLQRAMAGGEGGTACQLVDRSGATRPISRQALLDLTEWVARTIVGAPGKTLLASLPVGGVERLATALAALTGQATLLLPDPAERPDAGLGQHPPDVIVLDIDGLDRLHRAWLEDIDGLSWLSRSVIRWAVRQGRDESQKSQKGWKHRVAERVALVGLRAKLGRKVEGLDVIGAPKKDGSIEAEAFLAAVGVALRRHSSAVAASLAR